jgi:hypothetical protein
MTTFEQQLNSVADSYKAQGYQVVVRPGPNDLPDFAKNFKVELVGRRGPEGVLVAVKPTRSDVAADPEVPRYAEIIGMQPGWRFDLAILQPENPRARDLGEAQEPSEEQLARLLDQGGVLAAQGFVDQAFITAWAAFEAAMRRRLRTAGEEVEWGTSLRTMLNELYSSGDIPAADFRNLEKLYQLRNAVVHGFTPPKVEPSTVQFLIEAARRLLTEAEIAKQPA